MNKAALAEFNNILSAATAWYNNPAHPIRLLQRMIEILKKIRHLPKNAIAKYATAGQLSSGSISKVQPLCSLQFDMKVTQVLITFLHLTRLAMYDDDLPGTTP